MITSGTIHSHFQFGTEGGELYILDYKDGRVKVEVEDNTQLMMYTSAFIQMQGIASLVHINLCIVQCFYNSTVKVMNILHGYISTKYLV
jgi:hypothetical protein